jgi:hypothetical protein
MNDAESFEIDADAIFLRQAPSRLKSITTTQTTQRLRTTRTLSLVHSLPRSPSLDDAHSALPPFMTANPSIAAARAAVIDPSPIPQSRETGDAFPQKAQDGAKLASPPPVAKSWAHFVAGG